MPGAEGAFYQIPGTSGPSSGTVYLVRCGQAHRITDWGTYQTLAGGAGRPEWGSWWNGSQWMSPSNQPAPANPGWNVPPLPSDTPVGSNINNLTDAVVPCTGTTTTLPLQQSCAQCATGQNTGACAGCTPTTTPPGYVTTGTGTPVSLQSGLPLGFKPSSPLSIVGIRLPAWVWGAGVVMLYLAAGRGARFGRHR